jgi:hypothetical protein
MTLKTLSLVSAISIVLPVMVSLLLKSRKESYVKPLLFFVYASLLFEIFFLYTASQKIKNVQWSHLYTLVEFITLAMFFFYILSDEANRKRLLVLFALYTLYLAVNPFLIEDINNFNPIARSINSFFFIILSLLYMYKIYQSETIEMPEKSPVFWIVTALLFYFSVSFFTFLLSHTLLKYSPDTIATSWFFHSMSNIIKNLLITWGLWLLKN